MWCGQSDFHVDGNLTGFDFASALSTLDVKSLIIAGDHDLLQPKTAALTHESIRGSMLMLIPNSGHMSFVDQPDIFLGAVRRFLK
jgi:pimeloyl-ACP methyl ester carboxylesterase